MRGRLVHRGGELKPCRTRRATAREKQVEIESGRIGGADNAVAKNRHRGRNWRAVGAEETAGLDAEYHVDYLLRLNVGWVLLVGGGHGDRITPFGSLIPRN